MESLTIKDGMSKNSNRIKGLTLLKISKKLNDFIMKSLNTESCWTENLRESINKA